MADGTPITSALQPLVTRWRDAFDLAQSTPFINLSGPVGQMQAARQAVQQTNWPACATQAASLLLKGMDLQINAMLDFMSGNARRHLPDFNTDLSYPELAGIIGAERAKTIYFADDYAAIDEGRQYFGEFATELSYVTGEVPRH